MKKILITLSILFIFSVAVIPTPTSADTKAGWTPGNFFYFLDTGFEKINLFFIFNSEKKAEKALEYANERLAEIKEIAEDNKPELVEKALAGYEEKISLATEKSKEIKDEEKAENLLSTIADNTSKHQEILAEVLKKVPEEAKEAILNAIEASKKGYEQAMRQVAELKRENEQLKKDIEELKLDDEEGKNEIEIEEVSEKTEEATKQAKYETKTAHAKAEAEKYKLEAEKTKLEMEKLKKENMAQIRVQVDVKKEEENERKIRMEEAKQQAESKEVQKQEKLRKQAEIEKRIAEEYEVQRKVEEKRLRKEEDQRKVAEEAKRQEELAIQRQNCFKKYYSRAEIQTTVNQIKKIYEGSANENRQRILSEYDQKISNIRSEGEQKLTSAKESQRGFGTNTAYLNQINEDTEKSVSYMEQIKAELLATIKFNLSQQMFELQIKQIELEQESEEVMCY